MRENGIFFSPIKAVNIGVGLLGDALQAQNVDTVSIDWRPSNEVHLSPRILEILDALGEEQ